MCKPCVSVIINLCGQVGLADHASPPVNYNITGAQQWSWDPQVVGCMSE